MTADYTQELISLQSLDSVLINAVAAIPVIQFGTQKSCALLEEPLSEYLRSWVIVAF